MPLSTNTFDRVESALLEQLAGCASSTPESSQKSMEWHSALPRDTLYYMGKKKAESAVKTIRFDNDRKLLKAIEDDAQKEGRDFSQHVRFILRKHLDRKSK